MCCMHVWRADFAPHNCAELVHGHPAAVLLRSTDSRAVHAVMRQSRAGPCCCAHGMTRTPCAAACRPRCATCWRSCARMAMCPTERGATT